MGLKGINYGRKGERMGKRRLLNFKGNREGSRQIERKNLQLHGAYDHVPTTNRGTLG